MGLSLLTHWIGCEDKEPGQTLSFLLMASDSGRCEICELRPRNRVQGLWILGAKSLLGAPLVTEAGPPPAARAAFVNKPLLSRIGVSAGSVTGPHQAGKDSQDTLSLIVSQSQASRWLGLSHEVILGSCRFYTGCCGSRDESPPHWSGRGH